MASSKRSVANGHRHETMTNKSTHPLHSARPDLFHFFFSVAPPSAAATAAVSDRRKLKKEQIMAAVIFSVADAQQAKINDAVPVTWPR